MNIQVRNTVVLLFIATFLTAMAACNALNDVRGDNDGAARPIKQQGEPVDGDEDSRP